MNNEPKTEIVKCTQCGGDSVHLEKREFPIDWNAGRTKEGNLKKVGDRTLIHDEYHCQNDECGLFLIYEPKIVRYDYMTKEGVRGIIKSKIYDTHHIETRDEDEIIEIQYVKFPYKKEISDEQIEGMIESMN